MNYRVKILSTQTEFDIQNYESVLDAGIRNNVGMPYGCRNGSCGACKGKIIEGEVFYQQPTTALDESEQQQGYALFCQAISKSDLTIDVRTNEKSHAITVRKLPCRVERIEHLNHDVLRLYLKLPKTERLQFLAGQYIDILLSDGKKRSFSLANSPQDDEFLELHIRYYKGGVFSEFAFGKLNEKALLRLEGPLGHFYFRDDSPRPALFIAGGTGFAPVKGIIEQIINTASNKEVYLYWGARAKDDLYLNALAEQWARDYPHIHYIPVLSEAKLSDSWHGRTGLVHEVVLEDFSDLSVFDVYTCGPPPMTKAVCKTFIEKGLPVEQIFSDSFEFAAASELN